MTQKRTRQYNSLCAQFQHLATRTWHLIQKNNVTNIAIREDGITALNLQDLYLHQGSEFSIVDFSPYLESHETGADWEWWFMQPGLNFGAAVQAKKLSSSQKYDIGYTPSNGYPQIRRLLDYSKSKGITPMYCFYNWWQVPPVQRWPCGSFLHQEDLWGCALADGLAVWQLHLAGKNSLADLQRYTMPWHCIACCSAYSFGGPEGLGTRAFGISSRLRNNYRDAEMESSQEDDYANFPEPAIHEELPPHIAELQRYMSSDNPIDRSLVFRLFGKTPPSRVVMINMPDK